jgi:hypothetical protein
MEQTELANFVADVLEEHPKLWDMMLAPRQEAIRDLFDNNFNTMASWHADTIDMVMGATV